MRKVSIDTVRPGMKLGRSIYNSNGHVLLNAGVILTEKYIERLKSKGIPALIIDDGWLSDVEMEDVVSDEVRVEVTKKIKNFFQDENKNNASTNLVGIKELGNTVNDIIDQLMTSNDIVYNLVDIRIQDEYTFAHSVNVCILALITGIHLRYSKAKLYHLGMGALLHDIGKTRVPDHILNKPGKLTEEEFNEIKKHSELGYEILLQKPNVSRLSALIALQHHERGNGEGYPEGVKSEEIHEFAKITGIVDMYDALSADRVYRKAFSPHKAYEMVANSGNVFFEPYILNAFLYHVAAYPLGSIVKLNTGEIGAVVENRPGYNYKPKVRLLFASDGKPYYEHREFWLGSEIFIVKIIEDEAELNRYRNAGYNL